LERACADAPRDAAAHELLGFCLMKLFFFDEACDAFARGDGQDRYHDVNLGFCLRKAGRLPEALAAFRRAQGGLGPQDSWSSYCADQIAELDALGKARAVLCLAQADDFVLATLNGKTLGRARAGGEAAIVLDSHLREGRNELHLAAVNTNGPWSFRMRLYVGGKQVWWAGAGYAAKGCGAFDNDATVGILGEARIEIDASSDGGASFARAEGPARFDAVVQKLNDAEAAWKQQDFGTAIKIYEAEAKEFPKLDVFHLKLADACDEIALTLQDPGAEGQQKRERLRKAAAAARERWLEVRKMVAALAGDDAGAYLSLGQACSGIGKLPDAEGAFKRSLELDPNRVEAMVGLADVLVKEGGKGSEAKEWAEKAIEKLPSWPYAHCILGDALLDLGDAQAALGSYYKAIDLDPTQGEWMYGKIAVAMNKGGANAAAISAALKAASRAGRNAEAQKALGDAYMRGLKYEEALAAYRAARGIDPKLSGVAAAEGLCFELTGKTKPAIAAYERGLEDADDEMKELARRRLARVKFFADPPARARLEPGSTDPGAASGVAKDRAGAAIEGIKAARPLLAE
ncbi:MAG TPA: tetratricopeptide repeat protein, partial [Planctomycetota bacterium]|nr:tetratricopeptide repeat protein [Planctomycetota bacterium]